MNPIDIKGMIEAGMPGAEAHVEGDGSHFMARVVSDDFTDLPMIKQHKLVYATLGNSMEGAIHALSIKTYTKQAWEKARKLQVL